MEIWLPAAITGLVAVVVQLIGVRVAFKTQHEGAEADRTRDQRLRSNELNDAAYERRRASFLRFLTTYGDLILGIRANLPPPEGTTNATVVSEQVNAFRGAEVDLALTDPRAAKIAKPISDLVAKYLFQHRIYQPNVLSWLRDAEAVRLQTIQAMADAIALEFPEHRIYNQPQLHQAPATDEDKSIEP